MAFESILMQIAHTVYLCLYMKWSCIDIQLNYRKVSNW
jgi:hypothetical protein